MQDKLIDVRALIKEKNPKLLKWVPNFIIEYFRKILREDSVNNFITTHRDKKNKAFADAALEMLNMHTKVIGAENIPKSGGVIFAANHPLGGMDAIAIISSIWHLRSDIKFIVNDVLLKLDNLKDIFVGVNKFGSNFKESLKKVDETFQSDQAVFVFPAGLVSRKQKAKIRDLEWKKTFVSRAKKYNKPIVPVYIDGKLSNFFYRIANIRKALGIKRNIEMLFLVNEFFKQSDEKITLVFGEPIQVETLKEVNSKEMTKRIKKKVYALADKM